jgi:hypothetical protein
VRHRADPVAAAAEPEHLRHEGKPFEAGLPVQRGEDLFLAANLDEVTGAQPIEPDQKSLLSDPRCVRTRRETGPRSEPAYQTPSV